MFVLATVGTDHHPFGRFVDWIDRWSTDNPDVDIFVQYGTSDREPACPGAQWVEGDDLESMMQRADAIVCHGGPSTIIEARTAGTIPVVVPRNPASGEHVDGHQMRFADFMASKDAILLARTYADLSDQLSRVLRGDVPAMTTEDNQSTMLTHVSTIVDDLMARPCRPLFGVRGRR